MAIFGEVVARPIFRRLFGLPLGATASTAAPDETIDGVAVREMERSAHLRGPLVLVVARGMIGMLTRG